MTIIACDGKAVAADGLLACDGVITSLSDKKLAVERGLIFGMAGAAPMWKPLLAWHAAGAKSEEVPKAGKDDTWCLVAIDERGVAQQYCSDNAYPDEFPPPWAWGPHYRLALGAMYAGKTAQEAVAMVCERTMQAGGEIQVFVIAEALGRKPVREAAE